MSYSVDNDSAFHSSGRFLAPNVVELELHKRPSRQDRNFEPKQAGKLTGALLSATL